MDFLKGFREDRIDGIRTEKRGISGVCAAEFAQDQSAPADGKGVCHGRRDLLRGTVHRQYGCGAVRHRERDRGGLVFYDTDTDQCPADRFQPVRQAGEVGRCGRARADHRICQLGGGVGDRVQDGGAGVRYRVQDLYDRGTCDFVRYSHELGAWDPVLARKDHGDIVMYQFRINCA